MQCGSVLILVSKITEQVEGSLFPQTTSIYRCSNDECQEKKDKETAKRAEAQKVKIEADKRRSMVRNAKYKKA